MYLTNEQRIRLGLQGYGSDVPDEAVAAAEAALAGAADAPPAPEPAPAKKRPRTKKGEFQPDDPATPDVNEPWTGEAA